MKYNLTGCLGRAEWLRIDSPCGSFSVAFRCLGLAVGQEILVAVGVAVVPDERDGRVEDQGT